MATHNSSITCRAHAAINQYAIVKLVREENPTNGIPAVEMCNNVNDIIVGVCMMNAQAGDLVTVRLPFSGVLPGYVYANVRPGQGLTIGLANPGSLSNNNNPEYARSVAYCVQVGPISSNETRAIVIFNRARYE